MWASTKPGTASPPDAGAGAPARVMTPSSISTSPGTCCPSITAALTPRRIARMTIGHVDELDAYLDAVIVGERPRAPVRVELVAYDPSWPVRFEEHRARIAAALGDVAVRIAHVGSTAVPGVAAKPVVDVLVTVTDPDDEAAFLPDLLGAGYELRVREPGHRMVRPPSRDANVHVWAAGGVEERRYLALRDRLRASAADR